MTSTKKGNTQEKEKGVPPKSIPNRWQPLLSNNSRAGLATVLIFFLSFFSLYQINSNGTLECLKLRSSMKTQFIINYIIMKDKTCINREVLDYPSRFTFSKFLVSIPRQKTKPKILFLLLARALVLEEQKKDMKSLYTEKNQTRTRREEREREMSGRERKRDVRVSGACVRESAGFGASSFYKFFFHP